MSSAAGPRQVADFGAALVGDYLAGRAVRVGDALADVRMDSAEAAVNIAVGGMRAHLTVPVIDGGRWVAALFVHQTTPRCWTDDDEGLLREVAELTWVVIERARAERALRALNQGLEDRVAQAVAERDRAWSNARDLLLVIGTDGTIHAVNPAWSAILGWRSDEVVGRSYHDFIHPEDAPEVPNTDDVGNSSFQLSERTIRVHHKDDGFRWISWTTSPPERGLIYGVGRDITARLAVEADLVLAQEALRQSQKLESMGQLTGGVAHDFNNLLTPIIGGLDMLSRRGLGGDRERRLLDGALQSAERARTLVQRLLAFARRQPLHSGPLNVALLLQGMSELIASTSGPQIKVVVDVDPDLPAAEADANQVEMAILNLSVNARDAMPDGGRLTLSASSVAVEAGHRAALKPGAYVRLAVADTGVGMDQATLARAVEPFFSTKGIGKGTGLGLSMAHGLASQLGGALTIGSKPGLGSTIELWLPTSSVAPVDMSVPAAATHSWKQKNAETCLLVEDEELVRASTADMLDSMGYEVVEATSAVEALQVLEAGHRFDVVVTDHLMPGLSGAELACAVRARWPATPVLIVSGYSEVEGIDPTLPRLTKPFREAELSAALRSLETKRRAENP